VIPRGGKWSSLEEEDHGDCFRRNILVITVGGGSWGSLEE
jgi:hypothetical protein